MKFPLFETTTSRIYTHLTDTKNNCAIVSPFRTEYSQQENMQRLSSLKQEVRKLGYGFIELIARWSEQNDNNEIVSSDEHSLLIPKMNKELAISLGEKFEQSSIIVKEGTVCNEVCTTPFMAWDSDKQFKKGDVVRTFNLNTDKPLNIEQAQQIFSHRLGGASSKPVKGNRSFTLSEVYEVVECNKASTFSNQLRTKRVF